MHSEQWALSCVRALFDLRKALTEKNCPVMDEESENTLPASIHLGGLHGTAIQGAHQGLCGDRRAAGTAPGGPGVRAAQRPPRTKAASLGSGETPLQTSRRSDQVIFFGSHLNRNMCLSAQSCLTLYDPMDGSPPGSPVRGPFQARILEWIAMSSSRGSSRPRDQTHVSSRFFAAGPPGKPPNRTIVRSKQTG